MSRHYRRARLLTDEERVRIQAEYRQLNAAAQAAYRALKADRRLRVDAAAHAAYLLRLRAVTPVTS